MMLLGALRAATIALVATAASGAMPALAHAQDIFCERGDFEVRALEFRGNRALDDDDLALRVTTTPSSWGYRATHLGFFGVKRCLDRIELGSDIDKLKGYYRGRGFYSTKVDTVVTPQGNDAVRVTFVIEEGEPVRLARYDVTGLQGLRDSANLMKGLRLKVGQPFDLGLYRSDIDSIVRGLRDVGFYRADALLGHDVDTVAKRAEAFITVLPGKRARFGEPKLVIDPVTTERGQQISDAVVRRVLGIVPGEYYSDRAIVQAQRNLFQLGTYQHIEVAPFPDSLQDQGDTIVVLRVSLTEDYMRQLDSEFGWATLDCGRMRLQYSDKNLLGTARRFELTGQASKIGYGDPVQTQSTRDVCTFNGRSPLAKDSMSSRLYYFTGFSVRQPRLLGTLWVPTLSLYSERRGEFKAYMRSTQVGADLSATRDLGDRMPFRLGYTFEFGRTKADPPALCALFNLCDEPSRRQVQELAPLGVASATLARIRIDNLINPTSGTLLRGELRTSYSRALGTRPNLFFNKGTGDVAWYTPLGWQNVFASRLRAGGVFGRRRSPTDPTIFIPPQERLYAGGPTSVRGFQQNELGSKVYIARNRDVRVDTIGTAPNDTLHFSLRPDTPPNVVPAFDTDSNPERSVPLGGTALFVANFEYRIRDPFFFPDLLQYTLFVDGGAVWTRPDGGANLTKGAQVRWTPGLGVRARTPVGPVQVNVGWNGYPREQGPLFYNPDVTLLACIKEVGPPLDYTRNAQGQFENNSPCPAFKLPTRQRWYQQLTFTFSIGPDF